MWNLDHPWWEYILRATVVYAFVFTLIRLMGKKQIGEMSPFDLVLLLIISESVSAGITGGDNSLGAGLICVSSFVVTNYLLDILSYKSKKVEKLLEGSAVKIIDQGILNLGVCKKELITLDEVAASLREHGLSEMSEVAFATLETNGKITVVKRKRSENHEAQQDFA